MMGVHLHEGHVIDGRRIVAISQKGRLHIWKIKNKYGNI